MNLNNIVSETFSRCSRLWFYQTQRTVTSLTPKLNLLYTFKEEEYQTQTNLKNSSNVKSTINNNSTYSFDHSLHVPQHILRPSYVTRPHGKPLPASHYAIGEIKSVDEITRMREAGNLAGHALQLALDATEIGVTPAEIETLIHNFIIRSGGYPSSLGFHNFPCSLIVSVNEVCCHGLPNARPFQDGDIVTYDCLAYLNGYHGDCAATKIIGTTTPRRRLLVEACRRARNEAIALCKPGVSLQELSFCVNNIADAYGFKIVEIFCGHFIGREVHMLPLVCHTRNNKEIYHLKEGNTFTIEPIFTEHCSEVTLKQDNWSVVTRDGGFSAHWEHTILITANGYEILTPLEQEN